MGYKLPEMKYADGIRQQTCMVFGGLNHNLHAQDGELYDAENLTTDLYPLMGSRKERWHMPWGSFPTGEPYPTGIVRMSTGLYISTAEALYHNGPQQKVATLPTRTANRKLVKMGHYIIILPDMLIFNELEPDEESIPPSMNSEAEVTATFEDGTIYGEAATGNTIHAEDVDWNEYFKAGDAVQIVSTSNNLSAIIREIDGENLRFYENSFTVTETAETVEVRRKAPILADVFEHKNRLWGINGSSTIYASKLGDPFNWNYFDGTADDSWSLEILSGSGNLTAGASYTYPTLFKEDRIFRIYGEKPSSFQLAETVAPGCMYSGSAVVINNVLYYSSKSGVMAYTGSTPQIISRPLGDRKLVNRVTAGTDGVKYYLSTKTMEEGSEWKLYVYDTRYGTWQIENDAEYGTDAFVTYNGLVMMQNRTDRYYRLWIINPDVEDDHVYGKELTLQSFAEFGDFIEGDPNSKTIGKLLMRVQLGGNATLQIKISIDDGEWEDYATLTNPIPEGQPEVKPKVSKYLAIVPRRCDHFRLKLIGSGEWVLYSLTRETASGSQLKTV